MNAAPRKVWTFVGLMAVIAVAGLVYISVTSRQEGVTVYVGSSMRKPMEKCIEQFEKKAGIKVLASYEDSGDVLAHVRQSGRGEAAVLHEPYISGDKSGMMAGGFGSESHTLAHMTPAIIVAKGNPKNVKGLKDFTREGLKVGMTNAEYTTSGRIAQQALKNAGIQKQVMDRHPKQEKSSGSLVNDVQIGALDAVTAWNAVAANALDKVQIVPIEPEFMPKTFEEEGLTYANCRVPVGLVVLKSGKHPKETRRFVEFLLSPEGQAIWASFGFDVSEPASQPASQP